MRRLIPLALLLASCTSERDWKMVASTFTVGASRGMNGDGSVSKGARSYDMDEGDRVFVSIQPLAFLEPPKPVIVVPAEAPCPKPK